MPSTMEVRSLGSSAIQSFRYQRSIASTCSLSSLPAPPSLSSVSNGISSSASRFAQPGIEPAGCLLGAGHRLPGPVLEGFLVSGEILGRDDGPHRAEPVGQLAGLADLPAELLRVDRAAVDVLQRDPAPRQEPVQFDDPAHEVRVGLLPERFAALAEELVDQ